MKKHNCLIAQYFHSSSEVCSCSHSSEIDGMGHFIAFFNYCSGCGRKITEEDKRNFWLPIEQVQIKNPVNRVKPFLNEMENKQNGFHSSYN
jgi:hypothetical protein